MNNRQFKTVFLGSSNVGKSCIVKRIVNNQYDGKTEPTIGSSFLSKTININGEDITFQLWDTAGQEAFRALTKIYYRQSQIAILVYDITNKDSFRSLARWHEDLKENCDGKRMILALCGNKVDLENDVVTYTEAKKFAVSINAELFLVSAKTGQGIEGLIQIKYRGNVRQSWHHGIPNGIRES
ncbi:unnamed protein product (macronuclear) [Paramecium tetraurelia]|uniref:Uncharacterized protein n=1 Tax=Paramecium tetraurelia TaxID=5888 RepID=A0DPN2_PARTE|nr:uncharacterized protein GSPATT00019181001 [Paramecium tetraurelia]CAK84999.1 unnamed protein product [Paramecium tetraurelia]|eukprot:XP_001452396.1 hypothetical protein (macronuclear) [Paramecium tetraurelia strain d4-2]